MNPYSILIVDDSEEDRFLLRRYIKKCGLETIIAETDNAERALELLVGRYQPGDDVPDLEAPLVVFLDINMPRMNGWEFLNEFQKKQDQVVIKPVVFVVYSTSNNHDDKARIGSYDFVKTYIVKGRHTTEDLKETIVACAAA